MIESAGEIGELGGCEISTKGMRRSVMGRVVLRCGFSPNFGIGFCVFFGGGHTPWCQHWNRMNTAAHAASEPNAAMVDALLPVPGSAYEHFRLVVHLLAVIGYLLIGLYAGCSLVWMPAAFGITAVLSSLAAAAGLHITSSVLLMLADIADALVARSERDVR